MSENLISILKSFAKELMAHELYNNNFSCQ